MAGTGAPAILCREEQDSDVEDRPERLKHDKDPIVDEQRMSEEEDRGAEPDEIRLNADPRRAPLSDQMDDLRHIANKAQHEASNPQEVRSMEMRHEAARPRPHHDSFSTVIGSSVSSQPCGRAMLISSSAIACDAAGVSRDSLPPLRWTSKSVRHLAERLQRMGHQLRARLGVQQYETALELTYRLRLLGDAMFFQPDLQYIIHPGGTGRISDAFVGGLQAGINF
jgi:hypothetical protein